VPTSSTRSEEPQRTWLLPVALAVGLNAITVLGVVAFGWPAGNVFILFWVENAVIGASERGPHPHRPR